LQNGQDKSSRANARVGWANHHAEHSGHHHVRGEDSQRLEKIAKGGDEKLEEIQRNEREAGNEQNGEDGWDQAKRKFGKDDEQQTGITEKTSKSKIGKIDRVEGERHGDGRDEQNHHAKIGDNGEDRDDDEHRKADEGQRKLGEVRNDEEEQEKFMKNEGDHNFAKVDRGHGELQVRRKNRKNGEDEREQEEGREISGEQENGEDRNRKERIGHRSGEAKRADSEEGGQGSQQNEGSNRARNEESENQNGVKSDEQAVARDEGGENDQGDEVDVSDKGEEKSGSGQRESIQEK